MISVYDVGNDNYDRIGNAVLCPISGKITQIAGGNYSLSMVHPLDPDWKWTHLVPGAIVKVPVPKETIENSFSGFDADIYKTNTTADLREEPSAPQTISYPAWDINANYSVGDKVSNSGKNWQCTYFDETSQWASINPPNCNWWKQIASSTSGAAALVTLPAGTELYFVEEYDTTWYKMSTYYGLEGYILKSQVTFDRHVSASENLPRVITEQLFRIQEPSIDDDAQTVTVTGQHVSYDLAGTLISDVNIGQAAPAMAIGRMMDGLMIPYRGTIATNLTSSANGTYSGNLKGKNGIFALLDPDKGIVAAFDAKFTRDNWDLFVMAKTDRNLGFHLTYGRNVRGISWKRSDTSLVTRVVPVAKDEGGAELYLPEMWVDSTRINNYPVIKMEYLKVNGQVGKDDGTGTDTVWTESDLLDYMRDKAGERFSIDKADLIQEEVSIQIEMLGDAAEYAWLKSLEDVLLYDIITVSNPDIGLETELRVTEIEFDIIKEKITGLKVSNVPNTAKRTITGYNVQNNSITPAKLTDEVTDSIVSQVQGMIPEYSDPNASRTSKTPNTKTTDGYVLKGDGNNSKVWATDDQGNPAWRNAGGYVSDNDPTLAWGTQSKVGTVNGTDLHVTMPANPDTWRPVVDGLTSTSATDSLSANQGRILNNKILKPITITIDPVTNANGNYTHTTTDSRITEDLKAIDIELGTPETFLAPITISTANGSITLTCSNAVGSSTVTVTLVHTQPIDGGQNVPSGVTSTEFDILAGRIGALSTLDTTVKTDLVSAINEVNGNIPNRLVLALDTVTNTSGAYSHSTSDNRVTADMKAIDIEVGTPATFRAPITVTTGNGTVTLSCPDVVGSSTVTVTLITI